MLLSTVLLNPLRSSCNLTLTKYYFFYCLTGLDETVSVILQSPDTVAKIVEGIELNLRCRADGNPELRYEWYRNNLLLFRSERLTIRGKHLRIANISALDNGIYSCKVNNDAGEVDSTENFALTIEREYVDHVFGTSVRWVYTVRLGNCAEQVNCSTLRKSKRAKFCI